MKVSDKIRLFLLARKLAGIESGINRQIEKTRRTIKDGREAMGSALAMGLAQVPPWFEKSVQNLTDDIKAYDGLLEQAAGSRKDIERLREVLSEKSGLAAGVRFGEFLGIFMTRKAYRRYVYPQLAEMQAEYAE
jgi:hypothetical protein